MSAQCFIEEQRTADSECSGLRTDKDIGMAERLQEKSNLRFLTNYAQTAESINLEKTKTMTFSYLSWTIFLSRKNLHCFAGLAMMKSPLFLPLMMMQCCDKDCDLSSIIATARLETSVGQ